MGKLSLKDLLDPVQGQEAKDGGPSKVTQQFLEAGSQKVEELPLRKQLQIKRQSTYRTTQQEGDKWIGIVKLNRQRDSLNFVKREKDNASNVAYFPSTPLSPFHNKIQQQLKSLQLQSQSVVLKKEEDSLGQVDKQQARRRVRQARKQRSLVLQEQVRRRRIAKIKSKLYRKIKKRQRNREQAKRIQSLDPQQRTQFLQKLAKQRIHERITLRHKSKNRYITDLLRFGKGNKNSVQQSINEVNRIRREQLQKANQGFVEQLSEQFDEDNYREQALEELQKEIDEIDEAADNEQQIKGIEGMKFMKIGRQKQLKEAKEQARGLLKMLQEDNQQHQQEMEEQSPVQAQITRGKYGANAKSYAQTQSKQKSNYTEKNLKQFLQIQHNPQQLTQGIDISRLKQKYQPNRVELDLKQVIQENRDLFINSNDAVAENFREFQANKADELIAQLPQQPKKQKGWGSWAGPGISEPKVNHALEVKKKLAKIEQIKKKRRDSQMTEVIVRESYNKNLKDYFVNKVPAGYSSAEQFEYLQDERIGPEWNSLGQFRMNVKPKVVTQAGQVIQPVRLPKNLEKLKH